MIICQWVAFLGKRVCFMTRPKHLSLTQPYGLMHSQVVASVPSKGQTGLQDLGRTVANHSLFAFQRCFTRIYRWQSSRFQGGRQTHVQMTGFEGNAHEPRT